MGERFVLEIKFLDQSHYEINKDKIKTIIKGTYGLNKYDFNKNRWFRAEKQFSHIHVDRIVENNKTIALQIFGAPALAKALVDFMKSNNLSITYITPDIDTKAKLDTSLCIESTNLAEIEASEAIMRDVIPYDNFLMNEVDRGRMDDDKADWLFRRWYFVVSNHQRTKRGLPIRND